MVSEQGKQGDGTGWCMKPDKQGDETGWCMKTKSMVMRQGGV